MFPGKPNDEPPAFSLDKADQMRARHRRALNRTEMRMLVFLPILLGLMAWTIWDWRIKLAEALAGAPEPIPAPAKLMPMPRPAYDTPSALPAAADVAAMRGAANALVASGNALPLTAGGYDAISLAWAEARLEADRLSPPLPQRFSARDFVLADHVRLGTAGIIEGQLEDRLPAPMDGSDRPWQRLLVLLDEGQYAEVLSDVPEAARLPLNSGLRVTGRLLGYNDLTGPAGTVTVPLILGRVIAASALPVVEGDALAEFHRPWSMPEGIYDEIDDFRLWTETRPYYHTLGQVLRDRTTAGVWDDVVDGNQAADNVHLRPSDFRGKPFKVTGYVYLSWEDEEVAKDQPFAVARVVRVLIWRRDVAPVTETIKGVTSQTVKQVLRLYELAAITNQPLPERGAYITATGRFLKKRAIAVETNTVRDRINDVQRQSDRVYTWMYVTGPWEVLPDEAKPGLGILGWFITALTFIGLVIGVFWWLKEVKAGGRRMQAKVAQIRNNRARLIAMGRSAADPQSATGDAVPSPTSPTPEPGQSPPQP